MSGLLTLTHAEVPSIANIQKNYAVDLGLIGHNVANLLMEHEHCGLHLQ